MSAFRPVYIVGWVAVALALVVAFNVWPELARSRTFLLVFVLAVVGLVWLVAVLRRRKPEP